VVTRFKADSLWWIDLKRFPGDRCSLAAETRLEKLEFVA
jgi:hypothetical protein